MTNANQDLIDDMDLDGARFTVRQNDPEAISAAVAAWYSSSTSTKYVTVHDCGDIAVNGRRLSEEELIEFVRHSLAN